MVGGDGVSLDSGGDVVGGSWNESCAWMVNRVICRYAPWQELATSTAHHRGPRLLDRCHPRSAPSTASRNKQPRRRLRAIHGGDDAVARWRRDGSQGRLTSPHCRRSRPSDPTSTRWGRTAMAALGRRRGGGGRRWRRGGGATRWGSDGDGGAGVGGVVGEDGDGRRGGGGRRWRRLGRRRGGGATRWGSDGDGGAVSATRWGEDGDWRRRWMRWMRPRRWMRWMRPLSPDA
ncbi:Os04g0564100 [Oryza sativa Japonica Group]|uniref:Os04g0564100 protein n=1 Tax=Oryza sativa subsp. japonica TaxID=39947 RepID=A0A0P0WDL5_ORYSJ|nr:Os04g0564100 [Oryza sativa Japonica Group]